MRQIPNKNVHNFMHHSQQKLHRSTPDSGHDNRHCFSTFVPIVLQSALLIAGHLLARPSSVNHFLPCCSLSYSKYLLTLAMPSSGSFCEKCCVILIIGYCVTSDMYRSKRRYRFSVKS